MAARSEAEAVLIKRGAGQVEKKMLGFKVGSLAKLPSRPLNFLPTCNYGRALFNRKMGPLQRQLHHGELKLLRHAPMLESNFVQVDEKEESHGINMTPVVLTMAVACTSPMLDQSPDVLLVAHEIPGKTLLKESQRPRTFHIVRTFPLHFLRISVLDEVKKQLQLKTQKGHSYCLELCSPRDEQEDLFALWVKVINQRLAGVPMPFFHRDCRLRNDSCFEYSPGRGLFNIEMGPLQHQFHHGEVDLLRNAPMLESNFVQVNRRGETFDIHNSVEIVTVAIAACTNLMPNQFPNMLVVARSIVPCRENLPRFENLICQSPPPRTFELTRLLPLCFLRISVHNEEKKQLRFKQPTGRAWYLELCSHPVNQEDLFELWVKVINLLHPSSEQPSETTPLDNTRDTGGPEEAWRPQIPNPVDLPDTEAVHTAHPFYRGPSPGEDHARSKPSPSSSLYSSSEVLRSRDSDDSGIQSPSPLVRSQYSTEDPIFSTIIIQDTVAPGNSSLLNDVESEESLERPLSCKELHPEEQVEAESDLPSNRTTTKGRSKTPHRASPWKASKLLSLFRCCSCGRQKRSRRESKSRVKEKKP